MHISVSPLDMEHPLFTSFVDAKVLLKVKLISSKPHKSTVSLIHIEQLFTKETRFASTCSGQNFNSTVSFVCRTYGQNGIDNLFTVVFNLSFELFSLLLGNCNNFFILLFVDYVMAILHLLKHGLEILKESDFLWQFLHLLSDLRKFLNIDGFLLRVDTRDLHELFV